MIQVIYIPGLGDEKIRLQSAAVRLWRIWGVKPHVFQMHWGDAEGFDPKFTRLLALIEVLHKEGPVALVGASAGAAAVITAYAAEQQNVQAVVCIAGKINNPQTVGERYKQAAPVFWDVIQRTPAALANLGDEERSRILSIRAMVDMLVPGKDSVIPGAVNRLTWTSGHAFTIAWQLVVGAPFFLRFVKQQNQQ